MKTENTQATTTKRVPVLKKVKTKDGREFESELSLIGSMWQKQGKKGVYFTMAVSEKILAGTNLVIFENNNPKDTLSPDYFVFKNNT